MRTLIFPILLLAINAIGAPQPTTYLNAFTTNRSVLPIFSDNNVGISNRIAGPGGGTNWNFYGIGPNTVARLTDVTNSGNGLFVKKYNGPSDGQIATNLTAVNFNVDTNNLVEAGDVKFQLFSAGSIFHLYDFGANDDLITGDYGSGLVFHTTIAGYGAGLNVINAQTNSGTLDVADDLTAYGGLIAVNGFNVSSGIASFNTGIKLNALTPSRLMAITSAGYATNSVYSDSDIAALQAATNGVFVRVQSGTMNNVTSTNGNFISPTNQPGASNMMAETIQGLAGQNTNVFVVNPTGGVVTAGSPFVISSAGRVGIGTNVPITPLHVFGNGNIDGNFRVTGTFSNSTYESSAGFINLNVAGAGKIGLGGSLNTHFQNSAFTANISAGSSAAGLARIHSTNSTAQYALLVQTIATNSLAQFQTGNTLKFSVETNGPASYSNMATNAIAASGYTNLTGANQTALVTATAVSFTVLDRAAATIYTSPTLTTTLSIPLQPGWGITSANGLSGTVIPGQ